MNTRVICSRTHRSWLVTLHIIKYQLSAIELDGAEQFERKKTSVEPPGLNFGTGKHFDPGQQGQKRPGLRNLCCTS
jgi:hypothetical protein